MKRQNQIQTDTTSKYLSVQGHLCATDSHYWPLKTLRTSDAAEQSSDTIIQILFTTIMPALFYNTYHFLKFKSAVLPFWQESKNKTEFLCAKHKADPVREMHFVLS